MLAEAGSSIETKEKSNTPQSNREDLAQSVSTTESKPKPITVSCQIVLRATYETSVLVLTHAFGLIEVIPHDNSARNHSCVVAKRITDVFPGISFYITIFRLWYVGCTPTEASEGW